MELGRLPGYFLVFIPLCIYFSSESRRNEKFLLEKVDEAEQRGNMMVDKINAFLRNREDIFFLQKIIVSESRIPFLSSEPSFLLQQGKVFEVGKRVLGSDLSSNVTPAMGKWGMRCSRM